MAQSAGIKRLDGRASNEPRKAIITPGFQRFAEGSALIQMGLTKVLCAATIEERVPPFMRGEGKGWVTAEYSMLPRATGSRSPREGATGRPKGRSMEIERLIGRCLRAVTDREALGERTVILDCDVIQADGGTRTAAITGAYVALYQALTVLVRGHVLKHIPLDSFVAGMSVGLVGGERLVDLIYEEDLRAQLDFNVAMTDRGELVEIQGTAEGKPFPRDIVSELIEIAGRGLEPVFEAQREAIHSI